jgi:hypothetical protein
MVKKGENYSASVFELVDGYLEGMKSRPRAVTVMDTAYVGLLAYIQSFYWTNLKEY